MSLRRFVSLLENLPAESAFARAQGSWTLLEHLTAASVEAGWGANWQRGGGKGPKPKQIPRPGVTGGAQSSAIPGDVMTFDEAQEWSAQRKARWAEEGGGDGS